ncbi:MAG: acyl-ACP--UDP-N-acetylglucosamine O-acyltransferase [Raineya sp.]|nr:acyl-ACP--UDP-N-acetylglucosamine O-acyltransferase [Raineya sp.]MDW8295524.1 acyl-ACP--UDP-N-acetylglucosamine O-acyltransferase [Raineya sp.]
MISNLAYIHPKANIGKNVTIEPFATIYEDVVIGDNTWIGSNATIMNGARIGQNCRIFPGAVIAAIPQDLKFNGEYSTAEIGDNTTIRECATINRGTAYSGKTVIGSNTLVMAYVHVAHDCFIGNNCILVNAVQMAGHVIMDDFAIVGGTAAIHQFTRIGTHTMIAGGSLVRKDVPPFVKAGREPLSYAGVNSLGLRRRGFSNEQIILIQDIYRVIFQKGYNTTDAIRKVKEEFLPSQERDLIINFIETSERGIIRGSNSSDKYTFEL